MGKSNPDQNDLDLENLAKAVSKAEGDEMEVLRDLLALEDE